MLMQTPANAIVGNHTVRGLELLINYMYIHITHVLSLAYGKERDADKLAQYLGGMAQHAYVFLPAEEAAQNECVKEAIYYYYYIKPDMYRQIFRTVMWKNAR